MRIIIDSMVCCGSSECIKACPEKAIVLHDGKAVLDEAKCDLDGICIPACPQGAIGFLEN
ncbi:4Fe-4S binding protein [Pelobacter seleniigenes]|uniref:4Fe-4S binding protein n=1 Tax=Pelobacter seleniigenes TaxID=407188 RepID=UPI0004A76E3D|nr:4Fe-4S binding protein [Pelobacter seleniigenes]